MTDWELLRQYVQAGSQPAFAELAERHARWVHAICARQLRDAHLAEDVAQAVFLLLSQKAAKLTPETSISGWLYETARLTASNVLRSEQRRARRETVAAAEAAQRQASGPATTQHQSEVLDAIDSALERMTRPDRELLIQRFYCDKPVSDAAIELGISLEAARKRFTRAIDALRDAVVEQGVPMPAVGGAAALMQAMAETMPQVTPPRLARWIADGATPASAGTTAKAIAGSASGSHRSLWALIGTAVVMLLIAVAWSGLKSHETKSPAFAAIARSNAHAVTRPSVAAASVPATRPELAPIGAVRPLKGHASAITAAAISPDAKFGVTRAVTELIRWDLVRGVAIGQPLHMTDQPFAVAISPAGTVAAIDRRDIVIYDAIDAPEPRRIGTTPKSRGVHYSIAIAPDGKLLALGGYDGVIRLLDPGDGHEIRSFGGHEGAVFTTEFSPDGTTLLTGGMVDHTIIHWNVATGAVLHRFPDHTATIMQIRFSPDGNSALSFARTARTPTTRTPSDAFVRIWDLAAGKQRTAIPLSISDAFAGCFMPDGKHVAVMEGNFILVWNLETGLEVSRRKLAGGLGAPVMAAKFTPDARKLYSVMFRQPQVLCEFDLGDLLPATAPAH